MAQQPNTLTAKEKKQGWTLLFNGKDFSGWRQCNGTAMPKNWVIEDNAMKIFTAEGKKPGQGSNGDIVYSRNKFKNFELSVDWKAGKMANSGIFYYVREVPGKPIYYAAPEVQVLDNAEATDNKQANHLAGSLYDMDQSIGIITIFLYQMKCLTHLISTLNTFFPKSIININLFKREYSYRNAAYLIVSNTQELFAIAIDLD